MYYFVYRMNNEKASDSIEREFMKNKFLEWENRFSVMEKKMDKIVEILEKDLLHLFSFQTPIIYRPFYK